MKFTAFLLAALLVASPTFSQQPSIINQAHLSLVKVSSGEGEKQMFCTGVQVGIVRVLTAEHCVPPDNTNVILNDEFPARVVKKHEWLVLLDAPEGRPIIKIAERNPQLGEDATAIGYVDLAGTKLTLKRNVAGFSLIHPMMFLDGPLVSGMSGGPVINSKGELIGINQASNPFTGMVSDVKAIRAFLK